MEAIYCAVPHNLHRKLHVDIISAGKHLMGEKPSAWTRARTTRSSRRWANPKVFVRCSSEFPYFPAVQRIISWIQAGKLGRIIEVRSGFHHSSDMDVTKPLNWKRMVEVNGEYGCIGDLGIHTQHVPFRMGWIPTTVYASLSKIVTERPDGKGGMAPCRTWDNATLSCAVDHPDGYRFHDILRDQANGPGPDQHLVPRGGRPEGLGGGSPAATRRPSTTPWRAKRSSREPARPRIHVPAVPGITGSIFEFGFSDSLLQMWAAFLLEMDQGKPPVFGCFTPEETRISHALHTAALESNRKQSVEPVRA